MNFIDSALNVILNKMRPKKAVNEYDDSCPPFSEIPLIDEGLPIDVTWTIATHPVPALPVRDLFVANAKLIRELCYASSLSEEEAERFLLPVISNLAMIVHFAPASEDGHHHGYGGLFTHSLEVAYYAANEARMTIFDRNASPKEKYLNRRRWILTTTLAGLSHDMGKVFSQMNITDDHGVFWELEEPLLTSIRRKQIKQYYVSYCDEGDNNAHRHAALVHIDKLITSDTYAFLSLTGIGNRLTNELRKAVMNREGLVGHILNNADELSQRHKQ